MSRVRSVRIVLQVLAILLPAVPGSAQVRLEVRQGAEWVSGLTLPQMQQLGFRWMWAGTRPAAAAERQLWIATSAAVAPPTSTELPSGVSVRRTALPVPAARVHGAFTVEAAELRGTVNPVFYVRVRVDWTGGGAATSSWVRVAVQPQPTSPTAPAGGATPATSTGTIYGVAIAPQPVTQGVPAKITIAGFGTCGQIAVAFGDGKSASLTSVALPHSLEHTYYQVGSTTVTVKAVSSCKGQGGATTFTEISPVWSVLPDLCALTGCSSEPTRAGATLAPSPTSALSEAATPTCPTPTISTVDMTPPLEPGEELIVRGCGFGYAPQVRLLGAFPNGALPLQAITQVGDVIQLRVPPIKGVRDQDAKLQLIRKDGIVSAPVAVRFRAAREVIAVPASAFSVICSPATNSNDCHAPGSDSFYGYHSNLAPSISLTAVTDQTDADWDVFVLVLRNGWVIHDKSFRSFGDGSAAIAAGYAPGASAATLLIKWAVDLFDSVTYFGRIYIEGPAGVPYK